MSRCLFPSSQSTFRCLQVLNFNPSCDVLLTLKVVPLPINSGVVHNADNTHDFKYDQTLSNDNYFGDLDHTCPPAPPLTQNNSDPSGSRISFPHNTTSNDNDGASFLMEFFLHNYTSGLTASPFLAHLQLLQHNLTLHGITVFGLTVDEYRQLLLRHILVGDCMRGSENKDRTGCRHFRQGFSTANDIAASAFSTLLSATAAQRSTDDLLLVLKALNIKSTFQPRNLRRQIIDEFKTQALIFTSSTCADFMKLERYDKPTLLSIASSHNISLSSFIVTRII